jgi:Family of unknown function (DUF6232)
MVIGGILAANFDAIGFVVLIALLALAIWRLVVSLRIPPVYGLVIGTAGTQTDAVWSTDPEEIDHLVREVAQAIGHPDTAQMIFNVQNAVAGDFIQQFGPGSIGKAQHSGSGNIMGGR